MTLTTVVRVLGVAACVATAQAQEWDTIRARVSGDGSGNGKCTVEVTVDGIADIEVLGAEGRMRTLTGARASWKRLDCNMAMPPVPNNFHFTQQEARGPMTLTAQPGENRGVAAIHIEDPERGSRTYRFDLEWAGGSVFSNGGGRGGSIFDPVPTGPTPGAAPETPQYGVIDTPVAGWNDQVSFRGRGEGYYRNFKGNDALLGEVVVNIERNGRVQVEFTTNQRERMVLAGRIMFVDRDHLAATMVGGSLIGSMEILLDTRNRVQELAMTGVGRNRFELRWQVQ
jgi:hypothetical protein